MRSHHPECGRPQRTIASELRRYGYTLAVVRSERTFNITSSSKLHVSTGLFNNKAARIEQSSCREGFASVLLYLVALT
jgi:hypothetical protein